MRIPSFGPLAAFAALVLLLAVSPFAAVANRSGAVPGHHGAPADNGRDCTICHFGAVNSGPGGIAIAPPAVVYRPGSVVPITVSLTGTLQNPVNGFQLAAYNGQSILGGWTLAGNDTQLQSQNVGHSLRGSSQSSWTSYLTTPSTPVPVTLYAAGNDSNGNGNQLNDRIYRTSVAMTPGTPLLSMRAVPRTGTTLTFDLASPGDPNRPYILGASFSNAGILVGGRTIPLFPDNLLAITATNAIPQLFQNYVGTLDGTGSATANLVIFNNPALVGVTLFHAYIVLDPARPMGIGTISNGLGVLIL